jgi:hypothetical protein
MTLCRDEGMMVPKCFDLARERDQRFLREVPEQQFMLGRANMTMQKARYAVSSVIVAVFATILSVATADATTLGLQSPEGLVFQGANILWIADYKANTVFKVDVSNLNSPSLICKVSNLNGPTRLAISGANVLVVNTTGKTVQAYNSTNCTPVGNPLTGFNRPLGVAVSGPTTMVIDNGTDEVLYFSGTIQTGKQSLSPAAPGAIAIDPNGNVVIGFAPSGPSQLIEYTLGTTSPPQLTQQEVLVSDSTNTGPTGIAFAFLPLTPSTTTGILVSDLYSGNFVYYTCWLFPHPGGCGTTTAVNSGTGGTEGIALNPVGTNGEIFVANSTQGNITVYQRNAQTGAFSLVGTLQ